MNQNRNIERSSVYFIIPVYLMIRMKFFPRSSTAHSMWFNCESNALRVLHADELMVGLAGRDCRCQRDVFIAFAIITR